MLFVLRDFDNFIWILVQAELSNKRHRPIGIGVQGLADAFILMRYPFESEEAQKLNKDIFETIYYAALKTSCEIAKEEGPYETYDGCPVSKGVSVDFFKGAYPNTQSLYLVCLIPCL